MDYTKEAVRLALAPFASDIESALRRAAEEARDEQAREDARLVMLHGDSIEDRNINAEATIRASRPSAFKEGGDATGDGLSVQRDGLREPISPSPATPAASVSAPGTADFGGDYDASPCELGDCGCECHDRAGEKP